MKDEDEAYFKVISKYCLKGLETQYKSHSE